MLSFLARQNEGYLRDKYIVIHYSHIRKQLPQSKQKSEIESTFSHCVFARILNMHLSEREYYLTYVSFPGEKVFSLSLKQLFMIDTRNKNIYI